MSTSKGEELLLTNDELSKIIIFTFRENLKFFCKSEIIYIDETFSYAPKYFNQFFVIHSFNNEYYVPLIFCILNNKSTETCKMALSFVKDKALQNFNLILKPKYVTVYFEFQYIIL